MPVMSVKHDPDKAVEVVITGNHIGASKNASELYILWHGVSTTDGHDFIKPAVLMVHGRLSSDIVLKLSAQKTAV